IKAIGYKDDLQMPPKKKLSDRQIADLTTWVKMGAVWPGGEAIAAPPPVSAQGMHITDSDRKFWSFQPIRSPAIPVVKANSWVANPIDAFILNKLEAKDLQPNSAAAARELIRRTYVDLIGLPPPPEEVDSFLADPSQQAFEKLIDRLLAMPQYGE